MVFVKFTQKSNKLVWYTGRKSQGWQVRLLFFRHVLSQLVGLYWRHRLRTHMTHNLPCFKFILNFLIQAEIYHCLPKLLRIYFSLSLSFSFGMAPQYPFNLFWVKGIQEGKKSEGNNLLQELSFKRFHFFK